MSDADKFNPPYRYEYTEHGPVTIYDAVGVGWIARVKESLPYKEALAQAMVDGLNRAAEIAEDADLRAAMERVGAKPYRTRAASEESG